ncbi:VCBS repeat-containing protein [candidate division TA06 bacterium]|uniref:VCBS repeat-containing protein n=1 Tax=candidate division TA06 bacterium TaxID=2250710 RepID=A0A933ICG2_UNCT6|nr:VCBS repeat-containing protein [candidate division TA06 bacterium]
MRSVAQRIVIFIIFSLTVVGVLPAITFTPVASYVGVGINNTNAILRGYDSDHDGNQELWLDPKLGSGLIFEHKGNNCYDTTRTGNYFIYNFDIGDLDGDGFTDVVAESVIGSDESIKIHESPALDSFPTSLVWEFNHPDYDENNYLTITNDLDQDGKKEFIWHYLKPIHIFECTGDNSYQEVWTDTSRYKGEIQCGDFDCDGKKDFLTTGHGGPISDGRIDVWENTTVGVDSYAKAWTNFDLVHCNPFRNAQAHDMDGDGKPEFIVGSQRVEGDDTLEFAVFETDGDNSYHQVWQALFPCFGTILTHTISVGDVDGDGIEEMVFSFSGKIYIYRNIGPDSYQLIWQKTNTGLGFCRMLVYDLNSNGYKELVYSGYKDYPESTHNETHILEIVGEVTWDSLTAASKDSCIQVQWITKRQFANFGFNVWRSLFADSNYSVIYQTNDTVKLDTLLLSYSFNDSNVTSGTTYYYKVQAKALNDTSYFIGPASATYTGAPLSLQFVSFTASVIAGAIVRLEWQTQSAWNSYLWRVKRGLNNDTLDYKVIAELPGDGTTNEPGIYYYDDECAVGFNSYKLDEVDLSGNVTTHGPVSATAGERITAFGLRQNMPNPFGQSTTISYQLTANGYVGLKVYDVTGRLVKTLVNEDKKVGSYEVKWDGKDEQGNKVSNGIYLYRLISGEFQATEKMMMLR